MKMYTVLDSKVQAYLPPFLAANDLTAQRMLLDGARDPGSLLGMHPEDFLLFMIGEFDEQSGEIHPETHHLLGKITDFMEKPE